MKSKQRFSRVMFLKPKYALLLTEGEQTVITVNLSLIFYYVTDVDT